MDSLPILSLLFGSGILVSIWGYFSRKVKHMGKRTEALQLGVQAILRDRLIHDYNRYMEVGYAPIYAKENFENMWVSYHNLGKNGVMDEIHETFSNLPTERRSNNENH
jgi:hypothetical protein